MSSQPRFWADRCRSGRRTPATQTSSAALRLLGLAARAGALVTGTERVREGARENAFRYVIVAADASANTHDKLIPTLDRYATHYVVRYDRVSLGEAVGVSELSAIGIVEQGFADRIAQLIREEEAVD